MIVTVEDLSLISQRTLTAIVRDEQLGVAAALKENNRLQKSRLYSYIHDNRIPDPPTVPQASSLPCSVAPHGAAAGTADPGTGGSCSVTTKGRASCPQRATPSV